MELNLEKYLTVGALTRYLKYKFDSDDNLKKVYLKGEISNFKPHTSGHYYFSIKDDTSKINAVMFSNKVYSLTFTPTDGMKVLVTGRVSIYEATGNYQIYVEEMIEDGLGNLYIAFEQLKQKLAQEGLFDSKYKKTIPKIPSRIGIITAPTGAAIKDILSTIKRRFPICETILFPSLVQGENAALDIVRNIKLAENYNLDVLIVGRGGGSIEDLWPFNEEIVARAIFDCPIPVISAVGHEIDYTISDFVADLRAPTPTGAAELAVPNMIDLIRYIEQLKIRLSENILKKVNYQKLYLDSLKNSFIIKNPIIMYENKKQYLDNIMEKITNIINREIEVNKIHLINLKNKNILLNPLLLYKNSVIKLNHLIEKLQLVNPLETLKRGYTLTYIDNNIITDINNIKINDKLTIKFHNGLVKTIVEEIKEEMKNE
ncbi:MAG: exodeoxyribonuclease VII large subunit [Mollicutes bacterium]|nr:exodeoxyribonuclease VII large subunit [Mollicutes bacterium]